MRHLFKALAYSWGGFLVMLKEAAFRQELVMLLAALSAVCWRRGFSALGAALPWGLLVLITEALNTGIEKTVDLCTRERHPLAKAAKDAASFACGTAILAFALVCAREFFF